MSSEGLKVVPSQTVMTSSQVVFHTTTAASVSALAKAVAQPVTVVELVPPSAMAVPVDQVVAPSKVEHVRFTEPEMAVLVSGVRPAPTGLPRNSITVPICPVNDVTDQVLFEEPSDPAKKRYLPRYRLAEQKVSGQPQYRIALEATAQGDWGLAVHLDKYPAPAVEAASRAGEELLHEVAVILRYRVSVEGAGGVQKELTFQEVTPQNGGLRAVLRVGSLAERDQLVQAISSPDAAPALIIRRVIQVAIPAGQTKPIPGETPPINPRPVPAAEVMVRPMPSTTKVAMTEATLQPNVVMMASPMPTATKSASVTMMDQPVMVMQTPLPPADTTVPLYRPVTRVLDHTVEPTPFCFLPTLHSYIFRGLTLPSGDSPGLILHQVPWQDTHHSYYQDAVRRSLFYYLPDGFKIARRPESPHYPLMSVQILQTDGALDDVQFELAFFAMPFISQARLKAAADGLRQHVPEPHVDLQFQPLLADPKRFRLALPRANAASGIFEDRDKALVSLRAGIHDSVTLSMAEFQAVYDALHSGGSAMLFSGEVEVDLPGANERIPFTARITDMVGEVFDYREVADAASGTVSATLRNAIESPVRINRLGTSLRRGTTEVPARLNGLSLTFPISECGLCSCGIPLHLL